jgi:hypothetical protein
MAKMTWSIGCRQSGHVGCRLFLTSCAHSLQQHLCTLQPQPKPCWSLALLKDHATTSKQCFGILLLASHCAAPPSCFINPPASLVLRPATECPAQLLQNSSIPAPQCIPGQNPHGVLSQTSPQSRETENTEVSLQTVPAWVSALTTAFHATLHEGLPS